MDSEENMLGEELETSEDEEIADVADEDTDDDFYDEFEYDEDGNIIIPDMGEDGEEDEAVEEDKSDVSDEPPADAKAAGSRDALSDKDARIAELESELNKFRTQGRETLSKLGVNSDDVMDGLISLAAEADGITPQEYVEKKAADDRDAQARALLQQQEFEKLARADLAQLHASYPETKQYTDIRMLPKDILTKFGRFRDAGLSPKEAYAAADPDGIRNQVATAVKKRSLHESKSHLQTAVPKGSKDNSVFMAKSELVRWRELFPDKSDKEIISLYKSTVN